MLQGRSVGAVRRLNLVGESLRPFLGKNGTIA